ncbi:DUF6283 family protein [Crossiella sp. S99.1]|uniref:DUF6283 family protein n=1 Tax=Crossiella sp. S99.1 TaxID=2936271 RepID=UPI0020003ABE|nr:DUF6283 family protein [Crossiella sp. S99.1]MCK2240987.1 DUF6283 family protein [Crossiella sp. S99.2]MCK2253869.1 DUF6283 family protein [Crossiella sp. S99.1]
MTSLVGPPAPRPCESCPYRCDVAPGIWAQEEYDKLRRYDAPTAEQPRRLFLCHQNDAGSDTRRPCAGWVGCHSSDNLLAPRIALLEGRITPETFQAIIDYESPVPLAASGAEAAEHGESGIARPGTETQRLIDKIARVRSDLIS